MLQVVELRQQQAERLDMTNFQEKARNATQPRPHRRPHRPSGYPTGPLVPLPLTPCCVPRPPRTPPFLLPLPGDPAAGRVLRTHAARHGIARGGGRGCRWGIRGYSKPYSGYALAKGSKGRRDPLTDARVHSQLEQAVAEREVELYMKFDAEKLRFDARLARVQARVRSGPVPVGPSGSVLRAGGQRPNNPSIATRFGRPADRVALRCGGAVHLRAALAGSRIVACDASAPARCVAMPPARPLLHLRQ